MCYTADHANASGMWDKPREITGNAYGGNGFEIAYWSLGDRDARRSVERMAEQLGA